MYVCMHAFISEERELEPQVIQLRYGRAILFPEAGCHCEHWRGPLVSHQVFFSFNTERRLLIVNTMSCTRRGRVQKYNEGIFNCNIIYGKMNP